MDALKSAVQKIPRVPGRVQWAQSLRLESALARYLSPGSIFDGQSGIKNMREEDIRASCSKFCTDVTALVLDGWKKMKAEGTSTAEEVNSKFMMTEGAFTGKFAPLSDFYRGIEGKLGQPNPRLSEAMAKEHCARANAAALFVTPNYGLCTSPRWEWHWVLDPDRPPAADDLAARLRSSAGRFPGEVGDRFVETLVAVQSTAARPDAWRSGLDRLLAPGPPPGDLGAVLKTEEARARGVRVVERRDAPARAVLALPVEPDAVGPAELGALRDAVGRHTGGGAGDVEASALGWKAHVYCEHADAGGLRKALARLPAADAAREAGSDGLYAPPPPPPPSPPGAGAEVSADGGGLAGDTEDVCALRELLAREQKELDAAAAAAGAQSLHPTAEGEASQQGGAAAAAAAAAAALRSRKRLLDAEGRVRQAACDLAAARFASQTARWAAAGALRRQGRARQGGIEAFMARGDVRGAVEAAGLQREEVAGLRLYTGPLYVLYNALLREFPSDVVKALAGNRCCPAARLWPSPVTGAAQRRGSGPLTGDRTGGSPRRLKRAARRGAEPCAAQSSGPRPEACLGPCGPARARRPASRLGRAGRGCETAAVVIMTV